MNHLTNGSHKFSHPQILQAITKSTDDNALMLLTPYQTWRNRASVQLEVPPLFMVLEGTLYITSGEE